MGIMTQFLDRMGIQNLEKEKKEKKEEEEEEKKCKSYITAPKGLFPCVVLCCVSCSLVLRDMCDGACAPSHIMLSLSLD